MEENLSRYWMVENSVEVVNSLFYVLVLGPALGAYLSADRLEVRTRWPVALETRTPSMYSEAKTPR